MAENEPRISTLPIAPRESEIDRRGHVNNAVYLRWLETATYGHWCSLASADEHSLYDWIALRHEIDYRLPAYAGDELAITVQVSDIRRARAWYHAVIIRGDAVLMEARSCWGCIDVSTRRLTVIPTAIAERFLRSPLAG